MIEYRCDYVAAVIAMSNGTINCVPGPHVNQRLGSSVGHEDWGVAAQAIHTRVRTPSIHIDRPLERHAAGRRDPIEDGLGLHLVEGDAAKLGRVEGAHRGRGVEEGEVGGWSGLAPQVGEGLHALSLERV